MSCNGSTRAIVAVMVLATVVPGVALGACNTARGAIDNQPEPPALDTSMTVTQTPGQTTELAASIGAAAQMSAAQMTAAQVTAAQTPTPPVDTVPSPVVADARFDAQTILIDLSKDIDSLIGMTGHYTRNVPVLGVRFENTPGFDAKVHCNAVQPIVYKPKLEALEDGKIRASVENGRFSVDLDPKNISTSWVQDADASGQFFWIFPRWYGRRSLSRPWELTKAYNAQYTAAAKGSARRRWTAEAYINLAMRQYRLAKLSKGFPQGRKPTRSELTAAMTATVGAECSADNEDLICLASHLIEMNEAPPPGEFISADAFRVGDAGYQNSGVSTGVRQLDFGTSNDQAAKLVGTLLPATVGRYKAGYGYRRPIRHWDIGTLNRWYNEDGPLANIELSREEAKQTLINSHAVYLKEAVTQWQTRVDRAYPTWPAPQRTAVALIAIDLENVSGYRMTLPKAAVTFCDVMRNRFVTGQRSNASVVDAQIKRVRNGITILKPLPSMVDLDASCVLPPPPVVVPPVVTQPVVTPAPVPVPDPATPPVTPPVTLPVTPAAETTPVPEIEILAPETPRPDALPAPDNATPPSVAYPAPVPTP